MSTPVKVAETTTWRWSTVTTCSKIFQPFSHLQCISDLLQFSQRPTNLEIFFKLAISWNTFSEPYQLMVSATYFGSTLYFLTPDPFIQKICCSVIRLNKLEESNFLFVYYYVFFMDFSFCQIVKVFLAFIKRIVDHFCHKCANKYWLIS